MAVAYVYCSSEMVQTSETTKSGYGSVFGGGYDTTGLLGSILKQLYRFLPPDEDIPGLTDFCFEMKTDQSSRADIVKGIRSMISMLAQTFIVVDGLDECSGVAVVEFEGLCNCVASLADLGGAGPSANVLLFSRAGYHAIHSATDGFPSIEVDRGANIDDINRFIGDRSRQLTRDATSLKEIQDHLLSSANGMFLWASLVIDSIKKERTAKKMKAAAQNMPRGLSGAYADALKRILGKEEPIRSLAMRALLWTTNSKRPLNKAQLLEVLAVERGMTSINDDDRLDSNTPLTTDCADLLVLKDDHYMLLHLSLGDFLRDLPFEDCEGLDAYRELQVRAPKILAEDCIGYLSFNTFKTCPAPTMSSFKDLLGSHPFLEYAAHFWGDHVKEALEGESSELGQLASGLIRAESTSQLLSRAFLYRHLSNEGNKSLSEHTVLSLFSSGTGPLHLLSRYGLHSLLGSFSSAELDIDQVDIFENRTIDYAATNGRKSMCVWIIDQQKERCKSSIWLLGAVIQHHWTDIAAQLVRLGHSPTEVSTGGEGLTAIHSAASLGFDDIVEEFLLSGAHPDTRDRKGYTPLISAALGKHADVMRMLLRYSANVFCKGDDGLTALHIVSRSGDVEMASELLGHGADLEARKKTLETPLHAATATGSGEMIRLLLGHGANKEARTESGDTPLLVAVHEGRTDVVRIMLRNGANIAVSANDGCTALHLAAQWGSDEIMTILLARPLARKMVNISDAEGYTPLADAATNGSTACAKLLLEQGAVVEMANKYGRTPLMLALSTGHSAIAQMLVNQHGANPKHITSRKETAMHTVAKAGQTEHVHALISWGVDPWTRDYIGLSALSYAVEANDPQFVGTFLSNVSDLSELHSQTSNEYLGESTPKFSSFSCPGSSVPPTPLQSFHSPCPRIGEFKWIQRALLLF